MTELVDKILNKQDKMIPYLLWGDYVTGGHVRFHTVFQRLFPTREMMIETINRQEKQIKVLTKLTLSYRVFITIYPKPI